MVVHTGSAAGGDRDKSLRHARDGLLPLLDAIPDGGPDLLLEPMAGQGQQLCRRAGDLGPYLEGLGLASARRGVPGHLPCCSRPATTWPRPAGWPRPWTS